VEDREYSAMRAMTRSSKWLEHGGLEDGGLEHGGLEHGGL